MRPFERMRLAKAVGALLVEHSDTDTERILRVCGVRNPLPAGWRYWDKQRKADALEGLLLEESDEVLDSLADFLPENRDAAPAPHPSGAAEPSSLSETSARIFLVHGQAQAAKHEAARVLERGTGREVVVLHEQPNAGRTIIEKFEDHAAGASFAVVLLTGDDVGGAKTADSMTSRGRQNVIFELGFFFGKLGRKHVAVLLEPGVEKPSEIDGLVYIPLDAHGAWKQLLAHELEAAHIPVNRSRIP